MKKRYTYKILKNTTSTKFLVFSIFLIASILNSYSQVTVPFSPRTSTTSPSQEIYTIKGDFSMIGNTNLTLLNYGNNTNNNNDMIYVDVDTDINTFNSSSAELTFSTENGSIPECSEIIYAGLYWSGRAGADETFDVTRNGITKTFNKRKVLINDPNNQGYVEIFANSVADVTEPNKNIYFPSGSEGNMYSAYAEITSYVQQNGIGSYTVADVATLEGNPDNTGYYGGWGMVVIYENSKMNWRDITVFDGHAYVTSGGGERFIDISGFKTAQNGPINIKLGVMAGEGDVGVGGDELRILRQDNGLYERLSHSGNAANPNNFFNSSINTGGNARNPNLQNNTGLDIAMFNIDNTGNGIIGNGLPGTSTQSTRFRYSSTRDTYIIYNLTFSVDAYIPEPEGVLTTTSINGDANPSSLSLTPGGNAEYKIEIKNTGTEALNDTFIIVPVPASVDANGLILTVNSNVYAPLTSTNLPEYRTGIDPVTNVNYGVNGSIVWDIGVLPQAPASDPQRVLADLSFTLRATTDCTFLKSDDFIADSTISLNGTISGSGATSGTPFSTPLISGFETSGVCIGEPIPTPNIIDIIYDDYVNEGPTGTPPSAVNVECSADIPAFDISLVTNLADNSGITPTVAHVSDVSDNNSNPEIITRTYSITDDCDNVTNVTQLITINDITLPVITCPAPINIDADANACEAASVTIVEPTATDNCATTFTFTGTRDDGDDLSDPYPVGVTTITWIANDGANNSLSCEQTVTVADAQVPVFDCTTLTQIDFNSDSSTVCTNSTNITPPVATDNCNGNITAIGTRSDSQTINEPWPVGITTVTWTFTDNANNVTTCTQDVVVTDNQPPVFDCSTLTQIDFNSDSDTVCSNSTNVTPPTAIDSCGGNIIANGTRSDNAPIDAPWPLGTTTITWSFSDNTPSANATTCTQDVVVTDNQPPVFIETLPVDTIVECDNIPDAITLTTSDNCGTTNVTYEENRIDGNCESNFVLERTWTATDSSNLTTVYTQTITVQDTTAPEFTSTLPTDVTVECDNIPDEAVLTATDNCNTASITVSEVRIDGVCDSSYIIDRTYTATDACGLTTEHTQRITVQDNTAPEPTTAFEAGLTVSCTAIPEVPALEFADNCSSNVTVVFNETNSFDENAPIDYEIVRTWTVRDDCGNEKDHVQTLTVILDEVVTQVEIPERCFDDGVIDLSEFISVDNLSGVWELVEGDAKATLTNNIFNPTTLELEEDFLPGEGTKDYLFTYTTTDNGCISVTELSLTINADCVVLPCGQNDLEISKALTPNGDGINDSFDIKGIDLCGFTADVKIFNRWGALIYEDDAYTLGDKQGSWSGSAHKSSIGGASTVPNGTYYYIIVLKDSGLDPITGPLYLGTK